LMQPERRNPQGNGWRLVMMNEHYTAWQKGEVCALSSIIFVEDEHQPVHWEWLVSFSKMGIDRLSNEEVKPALRAFNAEEFEEDNHERGIARKYFFAVDPQFRKPCPCKDEIVITEGDYKYSIKKA
jgi:hypothetical protein